jgi:hypothetical protein
LRYPTKRVILVALLLMTTGMLLELYLLDHYEDRYQLIPLLGIAIALVMTVVLNFRASKRIQQLFKLVLVLISLSGIYGVFLHLQANFEFEQEIHPTASTLSLFSESISGAFPALAPLSLIVLALMGYAYLTLINQKK